MVRKRLIAALLVASCLSAPRDCIAGDWIITQHGRNFEHYTRTGLSRQHGIERAGLEAVSRSNNAVTVSYWERGGHRATIDVNGVRIIDGRDERDVARISGVRVLNEADRVHIRSDKRDGQPTLFHNAQQILAWPKGSAVQVLSFDEKRLLVAVRTFGSYTTKIRMFHRTTGGQIVREPVDLVTLDRCLIRTARVRVEKALMDLLCEDGSQSDIWQFDLTARLGEPAFASSDDDLLMPLSRPHKKGRVGIRVSGSPNAKHFFFASTGLLMTQLGEPRALASDGAGVLSWTQSYRILAHAQLFAKTGHSVFGRLAEGAMLSVLNQRNELAGVLGKLNPTTGWASRLYSADGRTPISLLVNQGMILFSLNRACRLLADACGDDLRMAIYGTTRDLATALERRFDSSAGLYRIPAGAPFRFAGHNAPWNWQLIWAAALQEYQVATSDYRYQSRIQSIQTAFVGDVLEAGTDTFVWPYWPSIVASSHGPAKRYRKVEDFSHAGVDLLALDTIAPHWLTERRQFLAGTLKKGRAGRYVVTRDIDGRGPVESRFFPSGGWAHAVPNLMAQAYETWVAGGAAADHIYAYAELYDETQPFDLSLTEIYCINERCEEGPIHQYRSPLQFLARNPLFSVTLVN